MTALQQISKLAADILQNGDNELRIKSEKTLTDMRDANPNELVVLFLGLLESPEPIEVRIFAITQLRKNLSVFTQTSFKNIWGLLTPETQEFTKQKLFEVLVKETDVTLRRQIADTIGEIAGSILSDRADAWPKFVENVWGLFAAGTTDASISAFNILETFLSYAPNVFAKYRNELYAVFKNSLIHNDIKIKSAGLKALSTHLQVLETKEMTIYEDLVLPIYEAAYFLLLNDKGNDEGLEVVSDIVEQQPKFLKKTFRELNQLMSNVVAIPKLEDATRRMSTEILLSFAERYPAFYRQDKECLTRLIEMIFLHMVQIESTISEEWKNPPEGYNDENDEEGDFETTRFGMDAVDRLISSVGETEMLPLLWATVQRMLVHQDWRYKYAAIMALSQIGEYVEEADNIKPIVQILCNHMGDANPMIRYACCHAFGQISDDMQPEFQEKYGMDVYPKLVVALQDPVNRVISHSGAALTNFLEGMTYEQIAPTMDKLVELLLCLCQNGISIVKESAMSSLASLAELAESQFIKYYEPCIKVIFETFEKYNTKEYKQLKGQSIETLTMIASAVGKEVFRPIAPKLIEYLIVLQSSQLEQVDPQKTYVLIGWQRLCLVLGQEIVPYLPLIVPSLFKLVDVVITTHIKLNSFEIDKPEEAEELAKESINTYETEEAEIALSMINVFVEELKEHYFPYAEQTAAILMPIIQKHSNEEIKKEACRCLPNLVHAVKLVNPEAAFLLAKKFIEILIEASEKEFETDVVIDEIESLKEIIVKLDARFLNSQELSAFSERIIKLLMTSDERKQTNTKMKQDEELEPEENELIDDEIKIEEEAQVAISELMGALFKTHKEMTMNLVEYIITIVLPKVFGLSDNMNKFGLFLIDDMVEYLGYELLKARWNDFLLPLLKYSIDKNVVVRQAACYGVGIYAQNTPPEVFKPFIENTLQVLYQSAQIAKGSEKAKVYGSCRDNAVAAIGKIVKCHGGSFDPKPVLKAWLHYLPLRSDKQEGCVQHEFLTDIMMQSPDLLLANPTDNLQTLIKIMCIYGDIIDTKSCNPVVKEKIKKHLLSLQNNDFFKSNYGAIWEQLSESQRKQLTDLIK